MDQTVEQWVRQGQKHGMAYWRAGPGTPSARADLDNSIAAFDQAYRLVHPNDPVRGQIAAQLGWLLTARHGAHGSSTDDRDRGIERLGEALASTALPPVQLTTTRVTLGQLHLNRATEALTPAAARGGFLGGTSDASKADADKAIQYLQEVIAGPELSPQLTTLVKTLLTMAEAILPMLSGNLASLDLGKMMSAMAMVQEMQQGGGSFALLGSAGVPSPMSFGVSFDTVDTVDYPVATMRGSTPVAPPLRPRRAEPARVAPPVPDAARQAARSRLAELSEIPERPAWEQVLVLLQAGPEQVEAADLDAFVGAAVGAVAAAEDGYQLEAGLDRLVAACGLCMREQRDGSGWGDAEETGVSDAAAKQLQAAARFVPPHHPAAAAIVEALGGMLDEVRPLAATISGHFAEFAAEVSTRSAPVVALSELCRVVTSGLDADAGPLEAAVAAIPSDHFAYAALSTAVQQVRLAAAIRALDADTVRTLAGPAPKGLISLLDALVHDDAQALRKVVDELAGDVLSPPYAAVVGASCLELVSEHSALDLATRLLSAAAEQLGDEWMGLRTRSWWRLATAYRRRGAPGDAECSRDAGMNALDGGGQDTVSAAWFAGQMLAEAHAAEAFTALEVAAAASGVPVPTAEDVLGVVLGIDPQASPAVEVPVPAEVATAVRKAGAKALVYLHPTDDAGRTAGVLCLDAETDRVDVLANVPVIDPLLLDDPGWSAITGRWSTGSLFVVATGNLSRLAMPAVRTGAGRRLARDVGVAYVSSGRRVIDLAGRPPAPVPDAALFVVNPEVTATRRWPTSWCCGVCSTRGRPVWVEPSSWWTLPARETKC